MRKVGLSALLVLTLAVAAPQSAAADPVTLVGGEFRIHHEGDQFWFNGSSFEIASNLDPSNTGLWVPKTFNSSSCFIPFQDENCAVGETFDVSFTTPGEVSMGRADATIDGQTYSNVVLRGSLSFLAQPTTIPSSTEEFFFLSSPFTTSGLLRGFSETGALLFSQSFQGSGAARTIWFENNGMRNAEDSFVSYGFEDAAPVPEPASLTLLATGLGMAALRARRKKQSAVKQELN